MAYTRLNPASGNPTQEQLGITVTNKNGFTVTLGNFHVYGKIVHATVSIKPGSAVSPTIGRVNPCTITGFEACLNPVVGERYHGVLNSVGNVWIHPSTDLSANTSYDGVVAALLP